MKKKCVAFLVTLLHEFLNRIVFYLRGIRSLCVYIYTNITSTSDDSDRMCKIYIFIFVIFYCHLHRIRFEPNHISSPVSRTEYLIICARSDTTVFDEQLGQILSFSESFFYTYFFVIMSCSLSRNISKTAVSYAELLIPRL